MQIVEQLEQVVRSRRQEQQSRTVLGVMDRDRILLHYRNTSQASVSPAGRGEMFAFCFKSAFYTNVADCDPHTTLLPTLPTLLTGCSPCCSPWTG